MFYRDEPDWYVGADGVGLHYADKQGRLRRLVSTDDAQASGGLRATFSGVGDGVTDDTAAWAAACLAGVPFSGVPGKTYRIMSSTSINGINFDFDGNGCQFLLDGDVQLISAKASFQGVTAITSIDNAATVDMSDGTVATLTEVAILTVANGAAYAPGQIVKVLSEDTITGEDPAKNRKTAEYAHVYAVSGNQITLRSRLRRDYVTSPRLCILNSAVKFEFRNAKLNGPVVREAGWTTPAMQLIGLYRPHVERVEFSRLNGRALRLLSCYQPRSAYLTGNDLRTQDDGGGDVLPGYLIHEVACYGGHHFRPEGYACRHVFATSATSASTGTPFVENYGENRAFIVEGGVGRGNNAASFDTHADAEDGVFIGCVSEDPVFGPRGSNANFGIRGRRIALVGCKSKGGVGFRFFSDFASNDNSRDHSATACEHSFNPGETGQSNNTCGFRVIGLTNGLVSGVSIDGVKTYQYGGSGTDAHFEATLGTMRVRNSEIRAVLTAQNAKQFDAKTSSTIYVDNTLVDLTGSSTTNNSVCRMTSDSSRVFVDTLRHIAPAGVTLQFAYAFGSVNATFVGKNIDTSVLPTTSAGHNTWGATGMVLVDYRRDDGRTADRASFTTTLSTAGQTLDVGTRYADLLLCRVTASGTAGISNITAGARIGQQLIISVTSGSSASLAVSAAGLIDVGSARTITAGGALRLVWTGSAWVDAG